MCQLLCDLSVTEGVRHEAAAVLAQMTAPWLARNHAVHGLERHLAGVVQALTGRFCRHSSVPLNRPGWCRLSQEALFHSNGPVAHGG